MEWLPPIYIKDAAKSKSVVEHLISKKTEYIVVVCCGENLGTSNSAIRMIILLTYPDIYMYHLPDDDLNLVKDGELDTLLKDPNITKVRLVRNQNGYTCI